MRAWNDVRAFAAILTPPVLRGLYPWFSRLLAALLAPFDLWQAAKVEDTLTLAQKQKGRNDNKLFMEAYLDENLSVSGCSIYQVNQRAPRGTLRYGFEGVSTGFDRFHSESDPDQEYDRFYSELRTYPHFRVTVPIEYMGTKARVAALIDTVREAGRTYTINLLSAPDTDGTYPPATID